ncbi:alpha/beta hydrolase [Streptomyces caelestis]|uniref:Alpha/beta hydrolase n=1 Tax=Streptomyces caelestis TaxID=36816 RepID=A0A0N0S594_9ACTN|nr:MULTISPECIES: alpha/beta hydrolase [Streptomyces]KOT30401.1 alpha/beta hydrolase [Streptomyces caelestis]KOV21565.1 alpha/beta hydrolase [Streptomyces sp. XY152]
MTAPSDLRFFPSADGDLAYLDTGTGDPVVLLHSGFADHRVFDAQIPALAAEHRVIAPDVRGHGASANATGPFRWADDLAGLLRHLDAGPAVLVGVSMGGAIATDTVLEYPELVRAVVVCGAATSDFQYTDPWVRRVQAEQAAALGTGDVEGWLTAFLRHVPGKHRTAAEVDPDILGRLREMVLGTLAKHTPDEEDHHVPMTDTWVRVPGIGVPVLAVNGALDAPDLIAEAERLAGAVRDGRSLIIDGTAHYPNLERPEELNKILLDFLRSLRSR